MNTLTYGSVESALNALVNGEIIMVLDDKGRENEGDLICAAGHATTEHINFMAKEARGLICTPVSKEIAQRLKLYPMVSNNTDPQETAFTVSIDHELTTTGISAVERAHTIREILNPKNQSTNFRRPGHVFPLIADENGVLARQGHTEATVDLMRLAGLDQAGVCVEIMNQDGTMMREHDLLKKAKEWDMVAIRIEDIEAYRKRKENQVKLVTSVDMPTHYGDFKLHTFLNQLTTEHHLALVKGNITGKDNVLTRLHSECLTGDVFGSMRCDCGDQLKTALQEIERNESGILLYMRQEGRGIGLVNKMKAYKLQVQGLDTFQANNALGFSDDLREYYEAAQILKKFNIKSINLMTNNPDKIDQLKSLNINVLNRTPLEVKANSHDHSYLKAKKTKMGHLLNLIQ